MQSNDKEPKHGTIEVFFVSCSPQKESRYDTLAVSQKNYRPNLDRTSSFPCTFQSGSISMSGAEVSESFFLGNNEISIVRNDFPLITPLFQS
jgi:hypothetical protein